MVAERTGARQVMNPRKSRKGFMQNRLGQMGLFMMKQSGTRVILFACHKTVRKKMPNGMREFDASRGGV